MQRVFTDSNTALTGLVCSLLEAAGIPCLVRNQYLTGALGEVPATECWPQVWVFNDDDARRALRVLAQTLHRDETGSEGWICPNCSEQLEAQFVQCWQCGGLR